MSRFDETIEYLQVLTDNIKQCALDTVNGLNETEIEKINIIVDKTVDIFNEASEKVKQAADVLTDENQLNAFLEAVEQKCHENKELAIEKFAEVLKEVPRREAVYTCNDTIDDIVIRLKKIINTETTVPVIERPKLKVKERVAATIKTEFVKEEPAKVEPLKKDIVDEVISTYKPNDKTTKVVEEADSVKLQEAKVKSSLETLLENENIKYAADFVTSMKDNVVEFLEKPETKEAFKEIKLTALKVADKGLDVLIKALNSNKKDN